MSHDITEPLRLAVGSHQAGSGKGCAMNVISWENGDTEITDFPECVDKGLAQIVQTLNDTYCSHRDWRVLDRFPDGHPAIYQDDGLLCPECSVVVLKAAHRTVGSAYAAPESVREVARSAAFAIVRDGEEPYEVLVHQAIDKFNEITGRVESPAPDPAVVSEAIDNMRKVAA